MELKPEVIEHIQQLHQKYAVVGQDINTYIEGLLHSKFTTYWDYIAVDTLLTLQKPKTDFPDEMIFILYHQITELYFKLILHELDQILDQQTLEIAPTLMRLNRIINYFKNLAHSFDVMHSGMEPAQFLQFRTALLPASGFQSAQFRIIEFKITSIYRLLNNEIRTHTDKNISLAEAYPNLYWKYGNIDIQTGKKTLTLQMFEQKYDEHFLQLANQYKESNLLYRYQNAPDEIKNNPELIEVLRNLDLYANVYWRLSHYKTAAKYLHKDNETIKATGGTNWQEYMPPRYQRVIFFPDVWTEQQIAEWGKTWIMELFKKDVVNKWGD